jgi:hypothetical protein
MSENASNTKGLGWAFMSCIFFILGMPILMLLAIEGSMVRDIQFDEPNVLNNTNFQSI